MEKKLSKHGNSLALILDKPLLKLLSIDEDTTLTIRIEGDEIILKPNNKKKTTKRKKFSKKFFISDDPKMQKAHEDVIKQYKQTFAKLAKN